jgi:outer membrane protein
MKSSFRITLTIILSAAPAIFSAPAGAEDLLQVFRDARSYDAQYGAARYALQAGLEKLPQGRSLILPTFGLTSSITRTNLDIEGRGSNPAVSTTRTFNTGTYQLTLSQPIYRPQNWVQYDQAEYQVRQAEAVFGQAAQDLVVRSAQAYFDVLSAQDTLGLVRAQKAAISEQLAQAKRNFEVGTATITDTHEAQARYDLSAAQEISALNDLEVKQRTLQQVTGKAYDKLKPLRSDVKLAPPNPNNMQNWVEIAEKQSFPVLIQEAASEIAGLEIKRTRAVNYPTVDLVANVGQTNQTGSTIAATGSLATPTAIGLQVAVPLYQGGFISSREREAAANFEKSKQDLENARRSSALSSRQSYLGVINGIAQISALEAALVSSQSALDSNKLGYEVGVRINIDVLNAQQQVFSTRRDLATARYNTITNYLRLKAAAGSLKEEDLDEVNKALQF